MSNLTINRVVLVGNLTRDPELRALPSGVSVCGLRVACSLEPQGRQRRVSREAQLLHRERLRRVG